jgi:hypothetical protein
MLVRAITYADLIDTDGFGKDFTDATALPNGAVPVAWMIKITEAFSMTSPFVQLWNGALAQGSINYVDATGEYYFNAAAPENASKWPAIGATLSMISVGADTNLNLATSGALEVWALYAIAAVPDQPLCIGAETNTAGDRITVAFAGGSLAASSPPTYPEFTLSGGTSGSVDGNAPPSGNSIELTIDPPIQASDTNIRLALSQGVGNFLFIDGRRIDDFSGFPVTNNVTP